jgi:uncharacterized membrane protein
MSTLLQAVTLTSALGCGLMAGVFFAFSSFVMNGLAALPPAQGVVAMQSINRTAITPPFMIALFGTGAACLGLAVWAAASWGERWAAWVLAGGALYLAGAIAVTAAANVPRNNALAALDPAAAGAAARWAGFVRGWTAWNHLRGAAALGAAALLTVGLAVG